MTLNVKLDQYLVAARIAPDPPDGYSEGSMHRLPRVTALVVAFALSVQVGARAACEAACLTEVPNPISRVTRTADVPQCHAAAASTNQSASLGAAEGDCQHGAAEDSLSAQRSLSYTERSAATVAAEFVATRGDARGLISNDSIHAPPAVSLAAIVPLRL